ncbi:protein ALP1-like [Nilaparvata lugens]|uniref:protein ALP1-like n=1 Tax=Nilaparvata lugens TaxID=108931 RepID=UPI00193E4916|nr:protein ALP1-like [Nilaparvata lugens]
MDLTREETAALLLLTDNVVTKLRPVRSEVHPINKLRSTYGEYSHLFPQLLADENRFFEYFRMSPNTFYFILSKIEHKLTKNWANYHKTPILPEERLHITLRFLSTGMSFRGLAFSFRMGKSTVANIVKETVTAIWDELQPLYMPTPSEEDFSKIANDFAEIWNFPHVIGCLDGKHIRIKCPDNSAAMFFNYRKFFSIVLQGLVDASYKFITVDVGGYGKQSDGGTFLASHLHKFIESEDITFPEPKMVPNTNVQAPFVMLADEAYPLLPHLMTPYKRKNLDPTKRNYNKRHSRARKQLSVHSESCMQNGEYFQKY